MNDSFLHPNHADILETLAVRGASAAVRRRAQLLLLFEAGQATPQIADAVGLSRGRVRYWRREYQSRGMAIFPNLNEWSADLAPVTQEAPQSDISVQTQVAPKTDARPAQKDSAGLEPMDTMAEAGRKILAFHFARMLKHEEGTRLGEDIEELHDMRVATRRMRAGFDVFGYAFAPKKIRPYLSGLRKTGRALGRVRDLDVFLEKAQLYLEGLPKQDRQGLDPLLKHWSKQRASARKKMLAYLHNDRFQRFKDDFGEFVDSPGAGVRRVSRKTPVPNQVSQVVPALIYSRLASVRAFEAILDEASIEQLHALRIEFKKLRYVVEFFKEVLGPETDHVIEDLKKTQDHLGDLNDADVARQILGDYLNNAKKRRKQKRRKKRRDNEPVVAYLASKESELESLIRTFPATWAYVNRADFRKNLSAAVSVL